LSKYKFECLRSEDRFLAVSSNGLAIVNVYLPTDYGNQASEMRSTNACRKLAKYIKQLLNSSHVVSSLAISTVIYQVIVAPSSNFKEDVA
jgi:exonuclease III